MTVPSQIKLLWMQPGGLAISPSLGGVQIPETQTYANFGSTNLVRLQFSTADNSVPVAFGVQASNNDGGSWYDLLGMVSVDHGDTAHTTFSRWGLFDAQSKRDDDVLLVVVAYGTVDTNVNFVALEGI